MLVATSTPLPLGGEFRFVAGTPYGDVRAWADGLDEPTVVYVEACEDHAVDICRCLHGIRLAVCSGRPAFARR